MNRLALVVAFAISIALIIGVSFYLGNITLNEQTKAPTPTPQPIINVTITHFNFTGLVNNPVGVVWCPFFMLNYTNFGTISTNSTYKMGIGGITGGTVYNETFVPNGRVHVIGYYNMEEPYFLGNIAVGETKQFHGDIYDSLSNSRLAGFTIFATLRSNGTVLDQAIIP